jgi:inorganic pyrophosphatase
LVVIEKSDLVQKKHDRRTNPMIIAQIESQIRYVTNADGETTDVLVPVELWQQLISSINSHNVSGLAIIDEQEPKAQILADLQESVRQAAVGQTFPVSELWDDIEA